MDEELFKLSEHVYELTLWEGEGRWHYFKRTGIKLQIPLYTSDYLLEKLPRLFTKEMDMLMGVSLSRIGNLWYADILATDLVTAETPLKALLKLTVALHEAGELNGQANTPTE